MANSECCVAAPPSEHSSGGVVEKWGDMSVYINTPPGASSSSKAVLLITDIFGWEAPLLRKLADKIASVGYVVVVPDYFHGDSFVMTKDFNREKFVAEWLPKHQPLPEPLEESKQVLAVLKERGFQSFGVAGFCWGAKVVVALAKEDVAQAAVILHPSFVNTEDIKEVKVPLAILGAEIDQYSPPALMKEFEGILVSKPEVPCFVKIFLGVSHGWTVRYEISDEKAVAVAEEAHSDLLAWFEKYL